MKNQEQSEFDDYASSYDNSLKESLGVFQQSADQFARYKIETVKSLLPTPPSTILDFGCGIGRSISHFHDHFESAELYGCDISEESIAIARRNYPYSQFWVCNSTDSLSSYSQKFDLVFLSCVLHHIPKTEWLLWSEALLSVLSPNGYLVVFEHNPYNPVSRYIVRNSPLDVNAELLTMQECKSLFIKMGFQVVKAKYSVFFPFNTRFFNVLDKFLGVIPLGGQYFVMVENTCILQRAENS